MENKYTRENFVSTMSGLMSTYNRHICPECGKGYIVQFSEDIYANIRGFIDNGVIHKKLVLSWYLVGGVVLTLSYKDTTRIFPTGTIFETMLTISDRIKNNDPDPFEGL